MTLYAVRLVKVAESRSGKVISGYNRLYDLDNGVLAAPREDCQRWRINASNDLDIDLARDCLECGVQWR